MWKLLLQPSLLLLKLHLVQFIALSNFSKFDPHSVEQSLRISSYQLFLFFSQCFALVMCIDKACNALLVKRVNGVWKVVKVDKSRHLFFIQQNPTTKKFCTFWDEYDPDFAPKKIPHIFWKQIWPKLRPMLRKAWRGAQWRLIFCMMKILTLPRKKALNSDFKWGPLHGETTLLK